MTSYLSISHLILKRKMQCKDCKFFYNNFPLVIMNTRAVANVFAKGFYMGNYVEVEYSYPANVTDGSKINSITAKVTVYSEYDKATKNLKNVMATDTEVLEFRNPIIVKGNADSAITAIHE